MVQLPAAAKVSVTEAELTKPLKKRRKNQAGSDDERIDVGQPPTLEQAPRPDTGQKGSTAAQFSRPNATRATSKIRSRSPRIGPISC